MLDPLVHSYLAYKHHNKASKVEWRDKNENRSGGALFMSSQLGAYLEYVRPFGALIFGL